MKSNLNINPLEKGMYVRTTYNIGKITDIYIVATDDIPANLWMILYKTNNKIDIGVFCKERVELSQVPRCKYWKASTMDLDLINYVWCNIENIVCYIPTQPLKIRGSSNLYEDHVFTNASFNISDLLQVGDLIKLNDEATQEFFNSFYIKQIPIYTSSIDSENKNEVNCFHLIPLSKPNHEILVSSSYIDKFISDILTVEKLSSDFFPINHLISDANEK